MTGQDASSQSTSEICLARHGRTELNAQGVLRGHLDPPLDEVGHVEAECLAATLASFRPKLIVSSPLQRAVETARLIAAECGLEVETDDQLIDRDYGEWSGQPLEEVRARFGNVDAAPGVELRAAVVERARGALEAIANRVDGGVAVVVAHDAINRLLISRLGATRYGDVEAIAQRTGCFNVLRRTGGSWSVLRVDVEPSALSSRKVGK